MTVIVIKNGVFEMIKHLDIHYKYSLLRIFMYPLLLIRRLALKYRRALKMNMANTVSGLLHKDPVLSIKEFDGIFEVDRNSDIFKRLIIEKEYEPKLVEHCKKYLDRNRDVIDIGANIGFFSVLFAKLISNSNKVLSIEPTKNALNHLYVNIGQNSVQDKVNVFEGVASNKAGSVEIKTIPGKEEYSSLGMMAHSSISKDEYVVEDVRASTIDELVSTYSLNPGFIKVDVEGVENLVFEGAVAVLKQHRPIILSELSDCMLKKNGSSSKAVLELIAACGYDIFNPIHPWVPVGDADYGDILCFPKEMGVTLKKLVC